MYTYIHTCMHSLFKWNFSYLITLPAKAINYLTKPGTRSLRVGQGCPRHSQNIMDYFCCLGGHPEVGGKSLLLKTPCTLDTGPRGQELDLTSSLGLAFTAQVGAMQASNRRKQTRIPPSYGAYELTQQQAWQDNPKVQMAHIPCW